MYIQDRSQTRGLIQLSVPVSPGCVAGSPKKKHKEQGPTQIVFCLKHFKHFKSFKRDQKIIHAHVLYLNSDEQSPLIAAPSLIVTQTAIPKSTRSCK